MVRNLVNRLKTRLKRLPLHHIDTSVLLEEPITEDGYYCKKYLNLLRYKYRGVFSFPMLGELFHHILSILDYNKRQIAVELIEEIIRRKYIDFRSVTGTEDIVHQIKDKDPRIEPLDRLILACAIADKSSVFVTLDTDMIKNSALENEFKIKIRHPKDLL